MVAAGRTHRSVERSPAQTHTGAVVDMELSVLAAWPEVGERKRDTGELEVTTWVAVLPCNIDAECVLEEEWGSSSQAEFRKLCSILERSRKHLDILGAREETRDGVTLKLMHYLRLNIQPNHPLGDCDHLEKGSSLGEEKARTEPWRIKW